MGAKKNEAILNNILEAIGNTPLVKLNKIAKGFGAEVLVKCEYLNPSGSVKDRMALCMVEGAEEAGKIKPGLTTITDASSGNTAQALSMVGAVKGYKIKLRFPEDLAAPEKIRALKRYGADYELVSMEDENVRTLMEDAGLHGAMMEIPARAKCLEEEENYANFLWIRQFANPGNVAGVREIGRELLEQTNGKIDVFVASIGTGGTFLGISQVLKEALPNVRCIAVQPSGWEGWDDILSPEAEYIPGISGGIVQEIRDSGIADDVIFVGNDRAREMAYRLSGEEGIYCGMSSGANVYVALEEAKKPGMKGKVVVTPIVDRGDRNISDERYMT
jgi:cysteine synthase A